jgi:hypothetical protein
VASWTLLVWALVPIALMSTFTSKLFHYAYPFLPPLAVAGGLAAATLFGWVRTGIARAASRFRAVLPLRRPLPDPAGSPVLRRALLVIGAGALAVAALTVPLGVLRIEVADVVLRSSSVERALAIAALALALAGRRGAGASLAALALLAALRVVPFEQYRNTLVASREPAHAMQAIRDCASQRIEDGRVAPGVYNASTGTVPHPYFYYLGQLGPWIDPARPNPARVDQALFSPMDQSPVVLSRRDHARLAVRLLERGRSLPLGVSPHPGVVVLLPGALAECVGPTVRAGGRPVGSPNLGGA